MIPFELTTRRLRLYAPPVDEVEALARGARAEVGARLGVMISQEWWLGPSLLRVLPQLTETMRAEPGDARWIWMVIEPRGGQPGEVIGDLGFHHPLGTAASVEVGYSVVPQARGFGYTTEAAAALIRATFDHTAVTQVIAQIEPGNVASLRVAAKLGMRELPPVSTGYRCFGISRLQAAALPT